EERGGGARVPRPSRARPPRAAPRPGRAADSVRGRGRRGHRRRRGRRARPPPRGRATTSSTMDRRRPPIVWNRMPSRALAVGIVLGGLGGAALGAGVGWGIWGRPAAGMRERLATLETAAAEVQGERDRLRRE